MALNESERTIAEAIKNMLDDTALGVDAHKDRDDERANTFTFLHEEIEQAYRLATISLEHHDSVCSAYSKIHSYKYLDDPGFALSFKGELASRGVPLEECTKALESVGKMIDKHLKKSNERDAGWNPDLDEIIKASQPAQIEESIDKSPKDNYDHERKFFSDSKVRKWINTQETFWEAVRKRISPYIEQLGYKCDTPKEFWEAYDGGVAEYDVTDRMHELFESTEARYQIHASSLHEARDPVLPGILSPGQQQIFDLYRELGNRPAEIVRRMAETGRTTGAVKHRRGMGPNYAIHRPRSRQYVTKVLRWLAARGYIDDYNTPT